MAAGAAPALWTGLGHHRESRTAAWELPQGFTADQRRAATAALSAEGLRTMLGGERVLQLAAEPVRLARAGLRARVDAEREPPQVLDLLDPLDEALHPTDLRRAVCRPPGTRPASRTTVLRGRVQDPRPTGRPGAHRRAEPDRRRTPQRVTAGSARGRSP
ncbi:hypothetical protein [Kitasatospora sp. NPDC056184]|uniref:hypothetical protein n=1 Tax=Kitasatospora sp. NPDC056184 TaxID=3345738 RepID=UPI0035E2D2C8